MTDKTNRATYLDDRSSRRKARRKPKLSEDTLAMQDRYREQGHMSPAEIAFLMSSDAYENLLTTEQEYGVHSEEYDTSFNQANSAVKTALPYFAVSMKAELITVREDTVSSDKLDDSIRKLINQ